MSEKTMIELENQLKAAVQPLRDRGPKLRKGDSRSLANVNHVAQHFNLPFRCEKQNKQYHLNRTDSVSGQE